MEPIDNGILKDINQDRKMPKDYDYHVEDGQFSFDFSRDILLGKEGETVKVAEPSSDLNQIYILYIGDYHVECIGNVEREFPKDAAEHFDLRQNFIDANLEDDEFTRCYEDAD